MLVLVSVRTSNPVIVIRRTPDFSERTRLSTFQDLKLITPLQRALREEGYTEPTPIQAATIPPALDGKDILGCAQTGTGKTAAFALPILNHFAVGDFKKVARRPLGLILAPTRELAIQIADSFKAYGRHLNISHALIYGGVGQGKQVEAVERGVHILIATPGRLLDLMSQDYIYLNRLQIFVLDEADRMLDMGFLPDLKRIIKALPVRRQSLFFSATMPKNIVDLANKLLHHPVRVDVAPQQTNVELIDQRVIFADFRQKKPLLVKLLTAGDVGQAIVFTRTKRGANAVAEYLRKHDIPSVAIHGNKSQNARQQALDSFRSDRIQVLVATDLAARGIDVEGISHVFNFELPDVPESYVHRIGRTGRAGARGIAIALCSPDERPQLQAIEKLIGFRILEDGRKPEAVAESVAPTEDDDRPKRKRRRRRSGASATSATNSRDAAATQQKRGPKSPAGEAAAGPAPRRRQQTGGPNGGRKIESRGQRRRRKIRDSEK